MSPPLVALTGITKRYGDVLANDAVDLALMSGETHALLGENGAGKSTLVKILYGAVEPSAGTIAWEGRPVRLASPVAARALGIGMVFQHFSLFEEMTVAENVAVALPGETARSVGPRLAALSRGYGLDLEPDRSVWTLSAGERQRIEIVRCLMQEPRLIILDEPTSVLTPQEAERLFETLDRLAAEGRTVLYISHRLEEVRRLCRAATVLRGGRKIATIDPRAHSARAIAAMMVGAEVGYVRAVEAPAMPGTVPPLLEVSALSLPPEAVHGRALHAVALRVCGGEILGIAGVAGSGQGELFAALSGERLAGDADRVRIAGEACGQRGIEARRRLGAAFVPEERLGHAAVPDHRLSDAGLLSRHGTDAGLVRAGFLVAAAARRLAGGVVKGFDVRGPADDPRARQLSGGNLQKFVVGREVARAPKVLVVDQPTWGVDAGAARLIRQAIVDLAAGGSAVVVVSQDLDELFEIATRLAVMHAGRLTEARPTAAWTREAVGLAMMGEDEARDAA